MRDAVAVLVMLAGLALGAVGALGWRGALRRNRFAGVRTPATLTSEDAFRLGNRVAAPPLLAAAAVAVLGGGAALGARSAAAYVVVLGVALAGVAGLALAGGVLGSRAAAMVPEGGTGAAARCAGRPCSGPAFNACSPPAFNACGGQGSGACGGAGRAAPDDCP